MPRLRYMGRDESNEPIWVEAGSATVKELGKSRWEYEDMTPKQKVHMGFQDREKRGWKSPYTKQEVKQIWGF